LFRVFPKLGNAYKISGTLSQSWETHEKSQARFPKVGKRMKNLGHVFPKLGNAYKISGTFSQSWEIHEKSQARFPKVGKRI